MKKLLALVLVVLIMMSTLSVISVGAQEVSDYVFELDTPISVDTEGTYVFEYTVEESGVYDFIASDDGWDYVYIYRDEMTGDGWVDTIELYDYPYFSYILQSGSTYYFEVERNSDTSVDHTVSLRKTDWWNIRPIETYNIEECYFVNYRPEFYQFSPDEGGPYEFFSMGGEDHSFVALYDSNWECLATSDYMDENWSFYLMYDYEAGEEYYFEVYGYTEDGEDGYMDMYLCPYEEPDDGESNIESIEVLKDPNVTVYEEGFKPDFMGMEIEVTYKDGTSHTVVADEDTLGYYYVEESLYVSISDDVLSIDIFEDFESEEEYIIYCDDFGVSYGGIDFVEPKVVVNATAENVTNNGIGMTINLEYSDGTADSLYYDVFMYYDPMEDPDLPPGVGGFYVDGYAKTDKGLVYYVVYPGRMMGVLSDYLVVTLDMEVVYNEPANALGDVDGDGEISILDASEIQRYLAQYTYLDDDALSAADTDNDGEINIIDASNIQRYLAQYITEF